jgi:hypothetical protein
VIVITRVALKGERERRGVAGHSENTKTPFFSCLVYLSLIFLEGKFFYPLYSCLRAR